MDEVQIMKAEKDIKNAWIAGTISAVTTFIVSMIGAYSESVRFEYGFDTWSLLDVSLISGLTYGIYRKKRFCALGMLIYFIASKFIIAASTGRFAGGVISIIIIFFFFQGTSAAFKLHKEKTKGVKKKKGWAFYLVMSVLAILMIPIGALIVIGTLGPNTEVVPGKMLKKKYVSFIRENSLIETSEKIEYWYSDALIDFRDGFYMLTDKKVLLYSKNWEEPSIAVSFSSISNIEFQKESSAFEDSIITLFLLDSAAVFFPVSSENDGDERFFERMKQIWEEGKDEYFFDDPDKETVSQLLLTSHKSHILLH